MLKNLYRIPSKISGMRVQFVDSCILSKLHFSKALDFNLPSKKFYKLQKLLDAGASFVFNIYGIRRQQSIKRFLQKRHFLPICNKVNFKGCLMVCKYLTVLNLYSPYY